MHHFATLLGYGACAINPYLALDTIHELIEEGMIKKDYYAAVEDYNHAVISGIVKIAAKMGISTIQSYQGSQIFEAIGISADVVVRRRGNQGYTRCGVTCFCNPRVNLSGR